MAGDDRRTWASVHLDMIRGLAALVVVTGHARALFFASSTGDLATRDHGAAFALVTDAEPMTIGREAVMVFFVLSGFLVGGSVLRQIALGTWSWHDYMIKRLARLWVVLIPVMVVGLVLDLAGRSLFGAAGSLYSAPAGQGFVNPMTFADGMSWTTVLGNICFLQTIFVPLPGTNLALWSLANEFWYYVAFPALVIALSSQFRIMQRVIYATISLAILAMVGLHISYLFLIWILGAVIAILPEHIPQNRVRPVLSVVTVGFVLLFVVLKKIPIGTYESEMLIGSAFGVLVYVVKCHKSVASDAIYTKIATFLSSISFTLYLSHLPLLVFATNIVINPWIIHPISPIYLVKFIAVLVVTIAWRRFCTVCLNRGPMPCVVSHNARCPEIALQSEQLGSDGARQIADGLEARNLGRRKPDRKFLFDAYDEADVRQAVPPGTSSAARFSVATRSSSSKTSARTFVIRCNTVSTIATLIGQVSSPASSACGWQQFFASAIKGLKPPIFPFHDLATLPGARMSMLYAGNAPPAKVGWSAPMAAPARGSTQMSSPHSMPSAPAVQVGPAGRVWPKIVLTMSHTTPGGLLELWQDLAESLRARGHMVELVAFYPHEDSAGYPQRQPGWSYLLDRRPRSPLAVPGLLRKLWRHFRQVSPAVVVTAMPFTGAACALIGRFAGMVPVIVTHHSPAFTYTPALRMIGRFTGTLRNVSAIVCVSRAVADSFGDAPATYRAKLTTICNAVPRAVERDLATLRAHRQDRPAGRRLIALGRLSAQKNYPVLLRAIAHLGDVTLDIVGDGEDRGDLEALRHRSASPVAWSFAACCRAPMHCVWRRTAMSLSSPVFTRGTA